MTGWWPKAEAPVVRAIWKGQPRGCPFVPGSGVGSEPRDAALREPGPNEEGSGRDAEQPYFPAHGFEPGRDGRCAHIVSGRLVLILGLVAAYMSGSDAMPGRLDADAVDWARDYFEGNRLCATATVDGLSFEGGEIVVSLDIDPRWARSLAKSSADIRRRWFALHCPPELLPIWALLNGDQDILVEGRLPDQGVYRLGCRDFLRDRR